ncbi:MAG: FAD-binding oxidoreductase [Methylococcales bacterium]
MTKITFGETSLQCQPEETLLEALLRENMRIPNGCRQGVCQSCLMRSLDNSPPVSAQLGLKDTLQAQHYFLACLCKPHQDMSVVLPDSQNSLFAANVIKKERLNQEIVRLVLQSNSKLNFFAGQFINLQRPEDGLTRSYSIANVPQQENLLELHIRRLANGVFSTWVHDDLQLGMTVTISEAQGSCHYLPGKAEQPMLLIGTGSGLAPLVGIIHDALRQGHQGPIHLYHGSSHADGLYLVDKMRDMVDEFANFHYTPCVSAATADGPDYLKGRAHDVALQNNPDLKGWRVYLCGHPDMVSQTKKMAYLKGASLKDIYADAFYVAPAAQ